VTAEFGPDERAGAVAAAAAAAGSPLVPSAVELDWPGGSKRPLRVGVLLEGTGPGVAERAKQMSELLAVPGGTVSNGTVSVAGTAPARWGVLPDSAIVVRVSFWLSALGTVLDAIAEAGAAAGIRPAVSGPAGAGALYACLDPGTSDADAVRFVTMLRDHVAGVLGSAAPRGRVAVLAAPPAVLAASWDRAVPGLALMRAVRDQFDPDHRMFPGRGAGPAGPPPRHGGGD
jgi:glycolate oxidase FAD binding subunit